MHVEKNESFCIVDTFQQVTIEGAALTLNIGIFCIKRPIIWPSVRLANTSSASLIIGVRDVCVWGGGDSLKFHSGNLLEQHPNLTEFIDDFRNFSYPLFDILLRIFNKKSRRMPVCENFTRAKDRSIRALWIVCPPPSL